MSNSKMYLMIFEYLVNSKPTTSGLNRIESLKELQQERECLEELQKILLSRLEAIDECELSLRTSPRPKNRVSMVPKKMGEIFYMPHVRSQNGIQ